MKYLRRIFYFLGSVSFAIILLALTMLLVILGTLTESHADSHQYAVQVIYRHSLFNSLLALFFINILVSALRRWPFKKKHIPFLVTHLGLLLVIGGTIVKNFHGKQGNLLIWEGSGSHQLVIPHSQALQIIAKDSQTPLNIPLSRLNKNWTRFVEHPKIRWRISAYAPHVHESFETWIKGTKAYITGQPAFPVQEWNISDPLPIPNLNVSDPYDQSWGIVALRTDSPHPLIQDLYLDQLQLYLQSKEDKDVSLTILLKEALQAPLNFANGIGTFSLDWNNWELTYHWQDKDSPYQEKSTFPLKTTALLKGKLDSTETLKSQFDLKLTRPISLIAFIDDQETTALTAFHANGTVFKEDFSSTALGSLIVYDQGFGGYAVQTQIPIPQTDASIKQSLLQELQPLFAQHSPLLPPFQFLKNACEQANLDFSVTIIEFFQSWNNSHQLLLKKTPSSLEPLLKQMNWELIPPREMKTIQWISRLFQQLSYSMRQGEQLLNILQAHRWPFVSALQKSGDQSVLSLLAQQIFAVIQDLPSLEEDKGSFCLLCAYFQLYGIDANLLDAIQLDQSKQLFTLETPLTSRLIPLSAPLKVEDHRPGIILEVEQNKMVQHIPLAYYPNALGLKWPILNGTFQLRFQPETQSIPHHVRLKQARQLTYPHSPQTYSYEADVVVTEKNQSLIPSTLSMNHVYETNDGYRFYLSSVQGNQESVKRIQLAVNYDPAKYWLTYPGAFFLFLGIGLLFWIRPYRKSH